MTPARCRVCSRNIAVGERVHLLAGDAAALGRFADDSDPAILRGAYDDTEDSDGEAGVTAPREELFSDPSPREDGRPDIGWVVGLGVLAHWRCGR